MHKVTIAGAGRWIRISDLPTAVYTYILNVLASMLW